MLFINWMIIMNQNCLTRVIIEGQNTATFLKMLTVYKIFLSSMVNWSSDLVLLLEFGNHCISGLELNNLGLQLRFL